MERVLEMKLEPRDQERFSRHQAPYPSLSGGSESAAQGIFSLIRDGPLDSVQDLLYWKRHPALNTSPGTTQGTGTETRRKEESDPIS